MQNGQICWKPWPQRWPPFDARSHVAKVQHGCRVIVQKSNLGVRIYFIRIFLFEFIFSEFISSEFILSKFIVSKFILSKFLLSEFFVRICFVRIF
jgi:hypothetical protein